MNSKTSTQSPLPSESPAEELADQAASHATTAVKGTRRIANDALDSLESGIDSVRQSVPNAFGRAAAQVEEITRRGLNRAKDASTSLREQMLNASDRTVHYIKNEPVKSVLVAAAAGATMALLVDWAMRSRRSRHTD